ncbi:glycosyltransferase family A protein [Microbacterium sp. zg-YB36]|uniref:glycosyltransferase family 2 protein n=1 Tax=Microbacterium sp. zg-YB36 TaxID=2969407 RepID=UPI00214A96D0|nr:glycosyltransferase family A protein [Microbacterium sp. zg-YB36]MDL5352364.1 glycosyltransferase family A protein [Microbacterium sp. zg-YB36]
MTVVIPCFNYGRFLPDAVKSALAQPSVDVEIIIVDDCSTDDSREVAERLAREHPEVRLVANTSNSGHVRSFNAGWQVSRGEFVVKLDADDLLTPGALGRAVSLFQAHSSVGIVYGHPRHFAGAEPPVARQAAVRWIVWSGRDWLAERCRLGVSAITNPEMVLRSRVLRELGPMDPEVPYAPDMEISLRVASAHDVGYIGGADQALHREHAASMSETAGAGALVDLRARLAAFEAALRYSTVNGAPALLASARRALSRDAVRFAAARADCAESRSEVTALLAFATDIYPASTMWRSVRRLGREGKAPARSLRRAWGRASRKLRHERYYVRWVVTGL